MHCTRYTVCETREKYFTLLLQDRFNGLIYHVHWHNCHCYCHFLKIHIIIISSTPAILAIYLGMQGKADSKWVITQSWLTFTTLSGPYIAVQWQWCIHLNLAVRTRPYLGLEEKVKAGPKLKCYTDIVAPFLDHIPNAVKTLNVAAYCLATVQQLLASCHLLYLVLMCLTTMIFWPDLGSSQGGIPVLEIFFQTCSLVTWYRCADVT